VQKLLGRGHAVRLVLVSDGVVAMRGAGNDNRPALAAACAILGITDCICLGFRDQQFDQYPVAEIANRASQVIGAPDLIITHTGTDLNRDHRIVNEVAKILGRPRQRPVSILGCEIPCVSTWNGKAFRPQLYVDISEQLETKIAAFSCYVNELRTFPDAYSPEGLRTMAKFRGMEAGCAAAEAFEVIRLHEGLGL
jgi:LmbE family N-acetylglucosaminyl deacetylase